MTATSTTPARIAPKFPWTGLIALATATFLSVTSEMIPTGLLPDMSASLGVSEAQIGLLVTVFAFTVVVTSAPLTALTRRWPRHGLLIGILVVLGISNALTAIAPDYAFVVGSRVLGGVAHGMFWSIVGAYAGHLVPKEQIGRAVSITLGGGTLAFVLGVPLGTFAGHVFGWRLSFGLLAALMMVGALVIWKFLPAVLRPWFKNVLTGCVTGSPVRKNAGTGSVLSNGTSLVNRPARNSFTKLGPNTCLHAPVSCLFTENWITAGVVV